MPWGAPLRPSDGQPVASARVHLCSRASPAAGSNAARPGSGEGVGGVARAVARGPVGVCPLVRGHRHGFGEVPRRGRAHARRGPASAGRFARGRRDGVGRPPFRGRANAPVPPGGRSTLARGLAPARRRAAGAHARADRPPRASARTLAQGDWTAAPRGGTVCLDCSMVVARDAPAGHHRPARFQPAASPGCGRSAPRGCPGRWSAAGSRGPASTASRRRGRAAPYRNHVLHAWGRRTAPTGSRRGSRWHTRPRRPVGLHHPPYGPPRRARRGSRRRRCGPDPTARSRARRAHAVHRRDIGHLRLPKCTCGSRHGALRRAWRVPAACRPIGKASTRFGFVSVRKWT